MAIMYDSKKLDKHQINYILKKYQYILVCNKFIVHIDHPNLVNYQTMKEAQCRIIRWLDLESSFLCQIRNGKKCIRKRFEMVRSV
ncbi:hypothetical protein DICPUDRAFT_156683 [Dictyostelium purpureum]|uniref:Reverse transcriptase RNase H-like domain-containing protein n=1 Tax=Dictyostelium purpureum TaxID=5786 RepID=F0ZX53_DICPU|nr:uncharacterized protein DICPUDRAFT_156683 [Dictyostelium purpureum]EGC31482.1 hypothetical protein DICPUDRAFT_156683 [Dictyostelium purpureum]|eukprot:XP_003291987.1 hypothetical protein DICPUDRAFT_156683 [Dictyostelium purpureum]